MRSAKKETKAKTSKFFKMKDVRQKSRKERTLRALRRRSEVARARRLDQQHCDHRSGIFYYTGDICRQYDNNKKSRKVQLL